MDSLHSVLPRALLDLFQQGPMSQGKLETAWRVAVGDAIVRVSTVHLQPDGSIEVRAADQRWRRELTRSSHIILSKLNGLLGAQAISTMRVK